MENCNLAEYQLNQIVQNISIKWEYGQKIQQYYKQIVFQCLDVVSLQSLKLFLKDQNCPLKVQDLLMMLLFLIKHSPEDNLPLSLAIIRLFNSIKQDKDLQKDQITFRDLTNFLYEYMSDNRDCEQVQPIIQQQRSKHESFQTHQSLCNNISICNSMPNFRNKIVPLSTSHCNSPPIYNLNRFDFPTPKISKESVQNKKDKKIKNPLDSFIYAQQINEIIALGRLSECLDFFNVDLKHTRAFFPKIGKDITIVSFSFSQRHSRLGCLVKGIGIVLSEASDNFITKKIIKCGGEKLIYLQNAEKWITIEGNSINFWSIQEEKITETISIAHSTRIHQVCQIPHLKSLCIAYNILNRRFLSLYHRQRLMSKLQLPNSGCHTLHYNAKTQSLLLLGYKSVVSIYHFDKLTWDFQYKGDLTGHNSIVTCITQFDSNSDNAIVITGDDQGYIRIWELSYLRGLQVVKLGNCMKCLLSIKKKWLLYGDKRINIVGLDFEDTEQQQNKISKVQVLKENKGYECVYMFIEGNSGYVITKKSLILVNLVEGNKQSIYLMVDFPNEQITVGNHLANMNCFIIGTSKGEVIRLTNLRKIKWRAQIHSSEVSFIQFESNNSQQSQIYVFTGSNDRICLCNYLKGFLVKSILLNKNQIDNLRFMNVCKKWEIIGTYQSLDTSIKIWELESLKLSQCINVENNILLCMYISDELPIILVGCHDGIVLMYLLKYKQKKLIIQKWKSIRLSYQNGSMMLQQLSEKIRQFRKGSEFVFAKENYTGIQFGCELKLNRIQVYKQFRNDQYILILVFQNGLVSVFKLQPQLIDAIQGKIQLKREVIHFKKIQNLKTPIREPIPKDPFERDRHIHSLYINPNFNQPISETQAISNKLTQLWSSWIHNTQILCFNIIVKDKTYIYTASKEGLIKINNLQNAQLLGELCTETSSSSKWTVIKEGTTSLKKQIHSALIIINNLLQTEQNNLSKQQMQAIDVKQFLMEMSYQRVHAQLNSKQSLPQLKPLRSSYRIYEARQIQNQQLETRNQRNISLKMMEAEKRIRMMKKTVNFSKENNELQRQSKYETKQFIAKKTDALNFLSPKYFPNILGLSQSQINTNYKGLSILKLLKKQQENDNQLNFKFRTIKKIRGMSLKHLESKCINTPTYNQQTYKCINNKSKKVLMKEINNKLAKYKQSHRFSKQQKYN